MYHKVTCLSLPVPLLSPGNVFRRLGWQTLNKIYLCGHNIHIDGDRMLHKEIYSSHIKGKWNIFHITPLKRPFSMTGKYYRGWILLWKIRLVRNVYLSAIQYFLVMSCGISMIGHFFLLFFVKHPERFCIGKRIWMWWVTVMPHYGLCSIMEINLQWEDAWCELIRFSLLAGNGIQIKITIKSPFHPPQCISVLIE